MPELKTRANAASVQAYLDGIPDERKRRDARTIMALMRAVSGEPPRMWGSSIVGFGSYHYRYASGHEGDACLIGFSSRKQYLTLYLMLGLERHEELLGRLGKYKRGKGCLYLKSLDDVQLPALRELIKQSVRSIRARKG